MVKSTLGPISPLQSRTTFVKLSENPLSPHPTFSILFNTTKTKAHSKVGELVLKRSASLGHVPYYHLVTSTTLTGDIRYQLESSNHLISPVGSYAYVILNVSAGQYELRIGNMHHYYLANKSYEVAAAGEIVFTPSEDTFSDISSINDRSGGYHLSSDDEDELVREFKKLSCVDILKIVGLPTDKYHAYQTKSDLKYKRRHSV